MSSATLEELGKQHKTTEKKNYLNYTDLSDITGLAQWGLSDSVFLEFDPYLRLKSEYV